MQSSNSAYSLIEKRILTLNTQISFKNHLISSRFYIKFIQFFYKVWKWFLNSRNTVHVVCNVSIFRSRMWTGYWGTLQEIARTRLYDVQLPQTGEPSASSPTPLSTHTPRGGGPNSARQCLTQRGGQKQPSQCVHHRSVVGSHSCLIKWIKNQIHVPVCGTKWYEVFYCSLATTYLFKIGVSSTSVVMYCFDLCLLFC